MLQLKGKSTKWSSHSDHLGSQRNTAKATWQPAPSWAEWCAWRPPHPSEHPRKAAHTRTHRGSGQGTMAIPGQGWACPGMTEDAIALCSLGQMASGALVFVSLELGLWAPQASWKCHFLNQQITGCSFKSKFFNLCPPYLRDRRVRKEKEYLWCNNPNVHVPTQPNQSPAPLWVPH